MSDTVLDLDREVIRELFDLRSPANLATGGDFSDDPYPRWHDLREQAPVHEGVLHELTGYHEPAIFFGLPYPDVQHFSVFSFEACERAFRNPDVFSSGAVRPDGGTLPDPIAVETTMLCMGGEEHRRHRALVQPSFSPAKVRWWMENWTRQVVDGLVDQLIDSGGGDLNVDFCAAIPLLTITGSFGVSAADALDLRRALGTGGDYETFLDFVSPVVEARRHTPADDLITVLVQAEMTDEHGRHRLTDEEIHRFAYLILTAGSGTTWKQMGITLATLLTRPDLWRAVRDDRSLLRGAIEESVRWMPTDPMFARWAAEDVDFFGVDIPRGSVVHLNVASASRDPARWDEPDRYDPTRRPVPGLGFGSGPHTCLGMHVARGEMATAIGALLDRCPELRLDPAAEPPRYTGMYERGTTEINVVLS